MNLKERRQEMKLRYQIIIQNIPFYIISQWGGSTEVLLLLLFFCIWVQKSFVCALKY